MEPKMVNRPAFTVVGMKYRGKNEHGEIPKLWGEFMPREGEIEQKVDPHAGYGVMGNYDEGSGEFDYVAGFEVDSAVDVPEGMVCWDVPEQKYAVFTSTLPTIHEALQHIYHAWLPESGYQHADGPEFELYDEKFDPQDPGSEMYLYIPVE